jgi:hypothetical protein
MASARYHFVGIVGVETQSLTRSIVRIASAQQIRRLRSGNDRVLRREVCTIQEMFAGLVTTNPKLPIIKYAQWFNNQAMAVFPEDAIVASTDDFKRYISSGDISIWFYMPDELASIERACRRRLRSLKHPENYPWYLSLLRAVGHQTFGRRKQSLVLVVEQVTGHSVEDYEINAVE